MPDSLTSDTTTVDLKPKATAIAVLMSPIAMYLDMSDIILSPNVSTNGRRYAVPFSGLFYGHLYLSFMLVNQTAKPVSPSPQPTIWTNNFVSVWAMCEPPAMSTAAARITIEALMAFMISFLSQNA